MRSDSLGSKTNMRPRNTAVHRLIQSSCTGRIGRVMPKKIAIKRIIASLALVGSVQTRNLRKLSKTPRPCSTADWRVAKLSSVRIMSAAPFATSVPVIPIAIPMSACLRAGASFTPSPVIATMWPRAWRAFTNRSFCSGATRAKTVVSSATRGKSSSETPSNSRPVSVRISVPGSPRPICPAMARAVIA